MMSDGSRTEEAGRRPYEQSSLGTHRPSHWPSQARTHAAVRAPEREREGSELYDVFELDASEINTADFSNMFMDNERADQFVDGQDKARTKVNAIAAAYKLVLDRL